MAAAKFVPLDRRHGYRPEEMRQRATWFRGVMQTRRSVRDFSNEPVLREVIEECLIAAGSAPSGANMQPWHFVAVSDPTTKRQIREAAEAEEREFYRTRAGAEWLGALSVLGTDHCKPFLETAPYLIVVFAQSYGLSPEGGKVKHYYVRESVGIATGLLITALHHVGLAMLPYTPSRPGFLNRILDRPENERPFVMLVVGHPAQGAVVPDIEKKNLGAIATFV